MSIKCIRKKKLVPFDYEKRRVQPTMKKAKGKESHGESILYLPSTR